MRLSSLVVRFAACSGLAALTLNPADAQEPSPDAPTNRAPRMLAKLKGEESIGDRVVERVYVDFGSSRYAFVLPPGYRMDATSEKERITLSTPDYSTFITLRILSPQTEGGAGLNSVPCRSLLLERYPGAKILEEFLQSAADRSGPAFDFQFTNRSGAVQCGRLAFIPARGAVLEFSVITPTDQFGDGQYWLSSVMSTFRSNNQGKLVIAPLSDRF
jgi:hypothetical protein